MVSCMAKSTSSDWVGEQVFPALIQSTCRLGEDETILAGVHTTHSRTCSGSHDRRVTWPAPGRGCKSCSRPSPWAVSAATENINAQCDKEQHMSGREWTKRRHQKLTRDALHRLLTPIPQISSDMYITRLSRWGTSASIGVTDATRNGLWPRGHE